MNMSNQTTLASGYPDLYFDLDDATWILTSLFAIVSIQAGMALREAGVTSAGNDVNIMTKCICSVVLGGFAFWIFGYALSFGRDYGTNPFCGWGSFFLIASDPRLQGWQYGHFLYHLSLVAMTTTIVSGAMAGRTRLMTYMVYCLVNVLVSAFPVHWVWGHNGWLRQLGALDSAGAGPVHVMAGTYSLVVTLILRPRIDKFNHDKPPPRESPHKILMGTCLLWCGYQGLAIGSAFGVTGLRWKLATRAVVNTFISSSTGAIVAIILSYYLNKGKIRAEDLASGVLGSLVGVSGICRVTHPWAAAIIGSVSALLAYFVPVGLKKLKVDDPVNGVAIHGACGLWGVLSVGIFGVLELEGLSNSYRGMIEGGGVYLLGVQILEGVILILWSVVTSAAIFKGIDVTIGLRVTPEAEKAGADLFEHGIGELPIEVREEEEKREEEDVDDDEGVEEIDEDDTDDSSSEGSQEDGEPLASQNSIPAANNATQVAYVNERAIKEPKDSLTLGVKARVRLRDSAIGEPAVNTSSAIERTPNEAPPAGATVVEDQQETSQNDVEAGKTSKEVTLEKRDSGYDSSEPEDKPKKGSRLGGSIRGSISKAFTILFSNDRPLSMIPEASTNEDMPRNSTSGRRRSILRLMDKPSESLKRKRSEQVLRFLEGERVTYPSTDTLPRGSRGQTLTYMFNESD